MIARQVFVSFDWHNDRNFRNILSAWHANPKFAFIWADQTSKEIQSDDVGRVKAAITRSINLSTHTLVIVGQYANTRHLDATQIGHKNWINFEVAQSRMNGNKLNAVKIKLHFESPDELTNAAATWVYGFDQSAILNALNS